MNLEKQHMNQGMKSIRYLIDLIKLEIYFKNVLKFQSNTLKIDRKSPTRMDMPIQYTLMSIQLN